MVIVWLGVVAVAVAVILPLYSLIGAINPSSSPSVPTVETIVIPESPSPSPVPTVIPLRIKILPTSVGYLNVRVQPSLTAGIIKQVKPGEIFKYTVSEKSPSTGSGSSSWYKIEYDIDSYGWVFGDYVEEMK